MAIEQNSIITASDITDILSKIGLKWQSTLLLSTTNIFASSITLKESVTNYDFISIRLLTGTSTSSESFGPYSYMPSSEWSSHNTSNGSGIRCATGGSYYYAFRFIDSSHIKYYGGNIATSLVEIYGHKIVTSFSSQASYVPKFTATTLWEGNISSNSTATVAEDMFNYEFISTTVKLKSESSMSYTPFFSPVIIHSSEISKYSSTSNLLMVTDHVSYVYYYFPSSQKIYNLNSSSLYFRVVGYKCT